MTEVQIHYAATEGKAAAHSYPGTASYALCVFISRVHEIRKSAPSIYEEQAFLDAFHDEEFRL